MISLQARIVKFGCRIFVKWPMSRRRSPSVAEIAKLRRRLARLERFTRRITRGLRIVPSRARAAGEWIVPKTYGPIDRAMLYVHGGAYVACSPLTHRRLTTALVRASGVPAFVVDYRLAPEFPFPAALDDVLAAFDALVADGIAPAAIVITGDSAGGGLACSAALALGAREPRCSPGGIVAFSPWTDLAATGESLRTNARSDDMLAAAGTGASARHYATRDRDVRDPLASPLYGDLRGFPDALVFASSTEILRDDATRFVERARQAKAYVDLVLEPEMPHVWPVFYDVMPEARQTIERAARYIARRCAAGVTSPEPPLHA